LNRKDDFLRDTFNLWVKHIPGGLTPVAQLLDQSPNRMFKKHLHDSYNEWALVQPTDDHGKMKPPSRAQLMTWAVDAWDKITPRMIVRAAVLTGGSRVCNTPLKCLHVILFMKPIAINMS
jgi:hypothetical protein